MIYIKVLYRPKYDNLFNFGFTGYGWAYQTDLDNNETVTIKCEDNFNGSRGYILNRKDLEICEIQKPNPYEY